MEPNTNPNVQPANPEQNGAGSSEIAVTPELAPAAPQGVPVPPPAAMPQIPNVPAQPTSPAQAVPAAPAAPSATPSVADDVDVIEKEWVDQANKIVDQHKDDPHAEEEAVEALQQDYLKKRYNHDVKSPDQNS